MKKLKIFIGICIVFTIMMISVITTSANSDDGVIRISCIGDSLTQATDGQTPYAVYLQKLLGKNYEVMNFGRGGSLVIDENDDVYYPKLWNGQVSLSYNRPDIVFIMFGTNDAQLRIQEEYLDTYGNVDWNRWKEDFKAGYKRVINMYSSMQSKPEIILLTTAGQNERCINHSNPALRELAAETNSKLYDMEQAFPECGNYLLQGDATHFTSEGYEIFANRLFQKLLSDTVKPRFDTNGNISVYCPIEQKVNIIAASYKDDALYNTAAFPNQEFGTFKTKTYNVDDILDISNSDNVRLFCWTEEAVPKTSSDNMSVANIEKDDDSNFIMSGNSFIGNSKSITTLVRDNSGKIVFFDQIDNTPTGFYKFIFKLPESESYTVKIGGVLLNLVSMQLETQ